MKENWSMGCSLAILQLWKALKFWQSLTTQQAAGFLNLSRSYVLKLIDCSLLPCIMTGTHRRLKLQDLVIYKAERETAQRQMLEKMTRLDRDLGIDAL